MLPTAPQLIPLLFVTVAAYAIKGTTGLGSALVFVTVGSIWLDPHLIIPVSALLDVVGGGAILLRTAATRRTVASAAWPAVVVGLGAGGLVGTALLRMLSVSLLKVAIGAVLIAVMLATFVARPRALGAKPARLDVVTAVQGALVAGVAGAAVGIDGPPLVLVLRRRLHGAELRAATTVVLLLSDAVRAVIYATMALITLRVILVFLVCLPALLAGIVFGERAFARARPATVSLVINVLIVAGAVVLVTTGIRG